MANFASPAILAKFVTLAKKKASFTFLPLLVFVKEQFLLAYPRDGVSIEYQTQVQQQLIDAKEAPFFKWDKSKLDEYDKGKDCSAFKMDGLDLTLDDCGNPGGAWLDTANTDLTTALANSSLKV